LAKLDKNINTLSFLYITKKNAKLISFFHSALIKSKVHNIQNFPSKQECKKAKKDRDNQLHNTKPNTQKRALIKCETTERNITPEDQP